MLEQRKLCDIDIITEKFAEVDGQAFLSLIRSRLPIDLCQCRKFFRFGQIFILDNIHRCGNLLAVLKIRNGTGRKPNFYMNHSSARLIERINLSATFSKASSELSGGDCEEFKKLTNSTALEKMSASIFFRKILPIFPRRTPLNANFKGLRIRLPRLAEIFKLTRRGFLIS